MDKDKKLTKKNDVTRLKTIHVAPEDLIRNETESAREEGGGIIQQWKLGAITREAAIKKMTLVFDHQHEYLKSKFSNELTVHKEAMNMEAQKELKELTLIQQEMMTGLGIRNMDLRIDNIDLVNDKIAAKCEEWQGKTNWPQQFIDEGLQQLFNLREQALSEILHNLGDNPS